MCVHTCVYPWRPEEGDRSLGTRVIGGCKLPEVVGGCFSARGVRGLNC